MSFANTPRRALGKIALLSVLLPPLPLVTSAAAETISAKLRAIVLPSIAMDEATLEEAVEFLRRKSIDLDKSEKNPSQRGVNIVIKVAPAGKDATDSMVTLTLKDIPLGEAIRYVADQAGVGYRVDKFAVVLGKKLARGPALTGRGGPGQRRIDTKLKKLVIPKLELNEATFEESIDYLRRMSVSLDTSEKVPRRRGINFVLRGGAQAPAFANKHITLNLDNIPLRDALGYVASLAGTKVAVGEHAVELYPKK